MLRAHIKGASVHWAVLWLLLVAMLAPPATARAASLPAADRPATVVGGLIMSDTTWTAANSPYIATSSVLVMENVTLTIEPGVTVKFDQDRALQVNGTLLARGTAAQPIRFTSNQASPAPGDWGYVLFDNKSRDATFDTAGNYTGGSVLQYAIVEYAGAEDKYAVRIQHAAPWIDHSTIQNNFKGGIEAHSSASRITNNRILNNGDRGIYGWHNNNFNAFENWTQLIIDGNYIANNRVGLSGYPVYRGAGILLEIICFEGFIQPHQVTNNVIEYNRTPGFGGGIYIGFYGAVGGNCEIQRPLVKGNIIRHNIAGANAGIDFRDGTGYGALVTDNQIYHNETSIPLQPGLVVYKGCAGIKASSSAILMRNLIYDNHAAAGGSNGGGACAVMLISNTIAGNASTGSMAGALVDEIEPLYFDKHPVVRIEHNTIAHNIAEAGVPGIAVRHDHYIPPVNTIFSHNTVIDNVVEEEADDPRLDTAVCIACAIGYFSYIFTPTLQHNNFWPSTTPLLLANLNQQGAPDLDATYNWWGGSDTTSINNRIYDFFDDSQYGVVNYANFLAAPNTDAPLAPPRNLQVTVSGSTFQLTWDPNQEPDLAGYKVYYDDNTFPYAGSGAAQGASGIDVGNVTSFSLSGLPANKKHFFAVTAYDQDGNESWYSLEAMQIIDEPPLENGDFEAGSNGVWDEHKRNQIRMSSWADPVQARNGNFYAILAETLGKTTLSQQVHINPQTPVLRYYWMVQYTQPWYQSGGEPCGAQGDGMFVYVGETQVGSHPPCTQTVEEGWQVNEIDLSSYAGQTVDLRFVNDNPNGYSLLIDDVAFVANPGAPGPNPAPVELQLDNSSLAFTYVQSNAAPSSQSVRITNSGGGALNWTATASASWIQLSSTGGSAPATLVVSVNPATLVPGVYDGTVTITSGAEGSPKVIAVTLAVAEAGAQELLAIQTRTLDLTDAGGNCTVPSQPVVTSQGTPLTWTAHESIGWLTLAETSGTTPGALSITCNTAGMKSGQYSGQIIITAPGSLPQVITVRLTIGGDGKKKMYLPGVRD